MADFPVVPDFPVDVRTKYKTLVSSSEAGYTQRRRKWQGPLREFPLSFNAMTEAEKDLLQAFFDTHTGAAGEFTFAIPNSTEEVTCCFQEDSLTISMISPGIYIAHCVLEEVK